MVLYALFFIPKNRKEMVYMEVLLPNFWFNVWKIRKNQNKSDEKGKTNSKSINDESNSFREVLDNEIQKYK